MAVNSWGSGSTKSASTSKKPAAQVSEQRVREINIAWYLNGFVNNGTNCFFLSFYAGSELELN